jgi:hypothetical protein
LAVAALLLAACGSGTAQAGPASSSTNTSSTNTTSTTSVSPIATPSAIAACNTDAQSVVTAVESYDALKGAWPTSPALGDQNYETYEVPGVGNICATI